MTMASPTLTKEGDPGQGPDRGPHGLGQTTATSHLPRGGMATRGTESEVSREKSTARVLRRVGGHGARQLPRVLSRNSGGK